MASSKSESAAIPKSTDAGTLFAGGLRDLAGIFLYTFDRFGRDQAARYVKELERAAVLAQEGALPLRGMHVDKRIFYLHRVKSHMIFHAIGDDGRLMVVRVLHQRMRLKDHL